MLTKAPNEQEIGFTQRCLRQCERLAACVGFQDEPTCDGTTAAAPPSRGGSTQSARRCCRMQMAADDYFTTSEHVYIKHVTAAAAADASSSEGKAGEDAKPSSPDGTGTSAITDVSHGGTSPGTAPGAAPGTAPGAVSDTQSTADGPSASSLGNEAPEGGGGGFALPVGAQIGIVAGVLCLGVALGALLVPCVLHKCSPQRHKIESYGAGAVSTTTGFRFTSRRSGDAVVPSREASVDDRPARAATSSPHRWAHSMPNLGHHLGGRKQGALSSRDENSQRIEEWTEGHPLHNDPSMEASGSITPPMEGQYPPHQGPLTHATLSTWEHSSASTGSSTPGSHASREASGKLPISLRRAGSSPSGIAIDPRNAGPRDRSGSIMSDSV